jgi:hypothetical protein
MSKIYSIVALALVGTVVAAVALKEPSERYYRHEDRSKLLKFSHSFHIDQGIACADCHHEAPASTMSSDNLIGDHQSCQSCHEEQISSECTFCHTAPDDIKAIANPPRELIFSHAKHTTDRSIACETCHSGLAQVEYSSHANMPSMDQCVRCHTNERVSVTCETCHTNFTSLVPEDHLRRDFRRDHKMIVRVGMTEATCATCHAESFCQDCHSGAELSGFGTGRNLGTDVTPRSSTKDSPKQLKLQQVHRLNFRFTHGADAKAKVADCNSCHEPQTFCADCHQAGGNITQGKFMPADHRTAGFVTIGRGTGGGLHAQLGRRDIESCIACHDAQGADPTCMRCHAENGIVR